MKLEFKKRLQVGWNACATKAKDVFAKWKEQRDEKRFWDAVQNLSYMQVEFVRSPASIMFMVRIADAIGSATGNPRLAEAAFAEIKKALESARFRFRYVGLRALESAMSEDVDIVQFFPQAIRLLADEDEFVRGRASMAVKSFSEGLLNPRSMDDKERDHYFLAQAITKALTSDWARQLAESNRTVFTNLAETCGQAMLNIRDGGYFDSYVKTRGT